MTTELYKPTKTKRSWQFAIVSILLAPPWAAFMLACYWVFLDNQSPVEVRYQSELFTSIRAESRDEARRTAITEAVGGTDVYIYREICTTHEGESVADGRPLWRGHEFVWSPPQRTAVFLPGCSSRSYQVDTPVVKKTQTYTYTISTVFRVNPLTVVDMVMPPVSLTLRAQ
jgi:hypothetical protein